MYVGFFFIIMETIPLDARHSLQQKSVFCPNFHMGILKTDSQTQIPTFKRNPKDKTKTQKKQNHRNTPTTTLPPKKPDNTKPPTH